VTYLWVKVIHIFLVMSWFAGLFYLPRIYVNLVQESEPGAYARLLGMAQRLLRFTTLLAIPAVLSGAVLWLGFGVGQGPGSGWMHVKIVLVGLVIVYHYACARILRSFAYGRNQRSTRWYRWFNELPVFLLLGIISMVVVKPF
jgi:protoporphyrinogen IX oxidase